MNNQSRAALVHMLIAKSLIEALLVGALSLGFFFVAFPPYFHGWGEATPRAIAGWVVDQHDYSRRVEVQLFIDDRFVSTGVADHSRPDIVAAGAAPDESHGYLFQLPPLSQGAHVARVYAVHSSNHDATKTLQLAGDPIHFEVDADGTAHWEPASRQPN